MLAVVIVVVVVVAVRVLRLVMVAVVVGSVRTSFVLKRGSPLSGLPVGHT
jgi:hypothetical protein